MRDRSTTRGNAQGAANTGSTAPPAPAATTAVDPRHSYGIQSMGDLQQSQNVSVGQATGFVGNAAGESGNFTQFHETLAATRDGQGHVLVPAHLAGPGSGGRGAIQWTADRRREFRRLIEQRRNLPGDGDTELPEAEYSDIGNNEAMIDQDLNGAHSGAAGAIRSGTPTDAAGNPIPDWVPSDDTARSTWIDFSEYDRSGVYADWLRSHRDASHMRAVRSEFNRMSSYARSCYDEYLRTHTHGSQEQ